MLCATGTENSGISVFMQNDSFVVDYNAFDDHTVVESDVEVPAGESTLTRPVLSRRRARPDGSSSPSTASTAVAATLPLFMRMMSSVGSSIGYDHGSAVSPNYRAPFPFTGTLHEIVIERRATAGSPVRPRPKPAPR